MSSGMTSDLDGSGNNDYFEVFVEGHGTTKYTSAGKRWANGGQSVTMSSYLRIGAPTSTSGQETATKYGDDLARTVTWKGSADVGGLAGKPVRLRFALSDADLYSLQFIPPPG